MPKEKEEKAASGISLPADDKGYRSSTAYGKAVVAESLVGITEASEAAAAEKDWRYGYQKHFVQIVENQAKSPDKALEIARKGLEKARSSAEFVRGDQVLTLSAAILAPVSQFESGKVEGTGQVVTDVEVPYKGQQLKGAELATQLDAWADYGCMEPSCAAGAKAAAANPTWLNLTGRQFIILGANSELGPLKYLLEAGATVFAVATKNAGKWSKLSELARATAGTLVFPVAPGADYAQGEGAGGDLVNETAELLAWLLTAVDNNKPCTVGTYLYADGEANVRLTLASDLIVEAFANARRNAPTSFAWLGSPATALVIPEEAVKAQAEILGQASWWQKMLGLEPNTAVEVPSQGGATPLKVQNDLAGFQGPNYALAQQLRQWRAVDLRGRGLRVSTNMAPPCRTASVVGGAAGKTIATALDGMGNFLPNEVFSAEAAKGIMFLLLVGDLQGEGPPTAGHPLQVFGHQAFHGGGWRCAWRMDSMGKTTYAMGIISPQR